MNLLDHPQILRGLFHPRREGMRVLRASGVRSVGVEVESGVTIGGRQSLRLLAYACDVTGRPTRSRS